MKRGSVVIVSAQGDYGKPRPAVVVQRSETIGLLDSITVCMMTSDLVRDGPMRITVEPASENGLRLVSQVQIEKMMTFPRAKVRGPIGMLAAHEIKSIGHGLTLFLDLLEIKR
ncbi:type II toxin-antitoxin system PemK/MazF family toxin [Jiella sonneratiae]|uniref:Type II toxin-antitoxin system PemK/MazF family toxin n=1 Tax=Jiella sonneratiae TaxID=2816856 RepID=A0ABS3J9U6_9HYPH|nr:type II toxin-antitoxin system PemK/MazF family toxin [Jiella sonneratiae]MBO0906450.1 type II toxin-antitoxin system PemK/MazF family toxin [Jiella sonneratiae]